MNLSVQGHNMDVSEAIQNYVEKKVQRLARYHSDIDEARVDLREHNARSTDERNIVQVTLYDRHGTVIRGEERAPDVFQGIDMVVDKLHRQITRFKGKRKDRYQRQAPQETWGVDSPLDLEREVAEEEEMGKIVRTKRFSMAPMDAEEAIEQMELLGHSFFVYYDAEEGSVNVVYRRRDGNYGHIIPELV